MRRLAAAAAALVVAACSPPDHTSPYDRSTPPALQARATLAGTVTLEPPGATAPPLGGISVAVQGLPTVTTDAAGAWVLENVPAGTYTVRLSNGSAWEEASVVVGVTLDDGGSTVTVPEVRLRVARGAVSGAFQLAGASSSSGVVVTLQGTGFATVTDASGAFSLVGVPVGTYAVHAEKADWQGATVPGVAVVFGGDANATPTPVVLQPVATASISGSVRLEGGAAGTGSTVTLSGTDFRGVAASASAPAGTDGGFSFGALVAGSYQVTLARPGFDAPPPIGVSVVSGQAASVGAITLAVSRGTLAGSVALSAANVGGAFALGADLSGVVVTLSGTDVPVPPAVTDAAGQYRFTDVPVSLAGTDFTVQARRPSFVPSGAWPTVTGVANATQTVPAITLQVNVGSLAGTALLWDDVDGAGVANVPSTGVAVSITGTAFNGTAYSTTAPGGSDASGHWVAPALPPGTYDVLATNGNRTCAPYPATVVAEGAAAAIAAPIRCVDAVAPTALALGTPIAPAGAQPGYTNVASATVGVATPAADATSPASNLRGYQIAVGAVPDWSTAAIVAGQPGTLTFPLPTSGGAPVDGAYLLSARAVDWTGNTGPAATAAVVVDHVAPPAPAISTARNFVNATSASVTLSGSDSSSNFLRYEACTGTSADPGTACGATPACVSPSSPAFTVPSYSVQLTANARNCIWARAVDKAGNASGFALAEIVSDLQPPSGPQIAPIYDPATFSVQATYVDFFVTAPATDGPLGAGPWQNVAWVEVDTGGGFTPICPEDACHASGAYDPCSAECACADPRLRCDSTGFAAIRVPLIGGSAGHVGVRAVDVAGNFGSGASQDVPTAGVLGLLASTSSHEGEPRVRGSTFLYNLEWQTILVDLGPDQRLDASDPSCVIAGQGGSGPWYQPLGSAALVHADYGGLVKLRRRGAGGAWCTGDTTVTLRTAPAGWSIVAVAAGYDAAGRGERAAWIERGNATNECTVWVQEPGTDGRLATGDDPAPTLVATVSSWAVAVQIGGNALLYRTNPYGNGWDIGATTIVNRGTSGFAGAGVTTYTPAAMTAALSADGRLLGYVGQSWASPQKLHVRSPGANGAYEASGDDAEVSRPLLGPSTYQGAIAADGGHVVLLEQGISGGGATYADHWYAGPNGRFEAAVAGADDVFERIAPSNNYRADPSIGTGLAGGVVYFGNRVLNDSDLQALDLSQLRWEAITDATRANPHANHAGTVFYGRATGGVTARAPDGAETRSGLGHGYWMAADGNDVVFDGDDGLLLLWMPADASGRFFTGATPTVLTSRFKQGYSQYPIGVAAGEGRVAYTAREADGVTDSVYVAEPNPTLATPRSTRLDGAPAGSSVGGFTNVGVSARHAVHSCVVSGAYRICVREVGGDGTFATGTSLWLRKPGAPAPYAAAGEVKVWRDRIAFRRDDGVLVVVDTGADRTFNTADDVETVLVTVPGGTSNFDVAGDFVAYVNAGPPRGLQVWLADVSAGTRRPVSHHYSAKENVTVEPTGRVLWEDTVFSNRAVFLSAP